MKNIVKARNQKNEGLDIGVILCAMILIVVLGGLLHVYLDNADTFAAHEELNAKVMDVKKLVAKEYELEYESLQELDDKIQVYYDKNGGSNATCYVVVENQKHDASYNVRHELWILSQSDVWEDRFPSK